jgi:hypothetical protein
LRARERRERAASRANCSTRRVGVDECAQQRTRQRRRRYRSDARGATTEATAARTVCLLAGRRLKERSADVLPVRQRNCSKVDYCRCPRHKPHFVKTINFKRVKNWKSTRFVKQSQYNFEVPCTTHCDRPVSRRSLSERQLR